MKVFIKDSFEKDTNKIHDKKLLAAINEAIEKTEAAATLSEIPQLKKLKGFRQYFRIRIGQYRIGISIENKEVYFSRFMHRKDIYKHFPPQ